MAYCANHPETTAAAYCRTCGKPLCDNCKRDVRGVIYCEECIAQRLGAAGQAGESAGAVPPPPIPPQAAGSGNPVVAALLALIPGVGAMYNGQFAKGFIHVAIFALLIKLADDTNGVFGIAIPAWIFYMVFEAYQTAKARQLGQPLPDFLGLNRMFGIGNEAEASVRPTNTVQPAQPATVTGEQVDRNRVPTGAYWLIGLGVFFLLANMNVFDWRWNHLLWEFVLIGFGVYLGVQRWTGARNRGTFCPCYRCRMRHMTGPAMIVTVGLLGLLDSTNILRWHNSWPLFLIVLGAVRMAQVSASTEGHIEPGPPAVPPIPPGSTAVTPSGSTEVHNG